MGRRESCSAGASVLGAVRRPGDPPLHPTLQPPTPHPSPPCVQRCHVTLNKVLNTHLFGTEPRPRADSPEPACRDRAARAGDEDSLQHSTHAHAHAHEHTHCAEPSCSHCKENDGAHARGASEAEKMGGLGLCRCKRLGARTRAQACSLSFLCHVTL